MLVTGGNPGAASALLIGLTTGPVNIVVAQIDPIGLPGHDVLSLEHVLIHQGYNTQRNNLGSVRRWRASKGSASVNRFTRAIGNTTTESWHRTMPVAALYRTLQPQLDLTVTGWSIVGSGVVAAEALKPGGDVLRAVASGSQFRVRLG